MSLPPTNYTALEHHEVYPRIDPRAGLVNSANGKVVLVTGSGRGVGRSIAITFALAGAKKVIITSRSFAELEEVAGEIKKQTIKINPQIIVISHVCSIVNEGDVEKLFDIAGDVDILINNAGALEPFASVDKSSIDSWWNTWTVNIKGTYLPTRELLKRAAGYGRNASNQVTIVNTASIGAVITTPGGSGYQSTKTAVNRLSEFLHFESPEARVFSYHPGGVNTLLANSLPDYLIPTLIDSPELAAGFVLWMTTQSTESDFLRGRYISCNWDVDQLLAKKEEIIKKNLLWTRVIGQETELM